MEEDLFPSLSPDCLVAVGLFLSHFPWAAALVALCPLELLALLATADPIVEHHSIAADHRLAAKDSPAAGSVGDALATVAALAAVALVVVVAPVDPVESPRCPVLVAVGPGCCSLLAVRAVLPAGCLLVAVAPVPVVAVGPVESSRGPVLVAVGPGCRFLLTVGAALAAGGPLVAVDPVVVAPVDPVKGFRCPVLMAVGPGCRSLLTGGAVHAAGGPLEVLAAVDPIAGCHSLVAGSMAVGNHHLVGDPVGSCRCPLLAVDLFVGCHPPWAADLVAVGPLEVVALLAAVHSMSFL